MEIHGRADCGAHGFHAFFVFLLAARRKGGTKNRRSNSTAITRWFHPSAFPRESVAETHIKLYFRPKIYQPTQKHAP